MSSKKQTTQSHNNCGNESSIGAKSDDNRNSLHSSSKQTNSTQESDQRSDKSSSKACHLATAGNSHIPRYTGGRQRRHSDNESVGARVYNNCCDLSQTDGPNSPVVSNVCSIHGIRSQNDTLLYELLQNMDLNPNQCQIPDQIRALHKNHVCSNVGKSRSVPNSKLNSVLATPLSTPSTPTDSRKMSFNRNSLSQMSTPLRQSKSSLSMTSQTTRQSNQKTFAEYMPLCEVQRGLQKGEIVEGVLRINPRNYMDAYISAPEGGIDIYVGGMTDRNRALNGDRVAILLNQTKHWKVLFDIIRIHWEEWGIYFQSILTNHNKSTNKETPEPIAQSSQTILSSIDESDESTDNFKLTKQLNQTVTENSENQSVNETISVDKINDRTDNSNLTQKSKSRKKRKRSRNKNKLKTDETIDNEDVNQSRVNKISLLKPEIRDSLIVSKESIITSNFDELSQELAKIQESGVEKLLELPFWSKFIQKTGRVVAIIDQIHIRIAGGRLLHMKEKNQNWALFSPNDSRIPRMRIPMNTCPPDFFHHSDHYTQTLFIAKLEEWKTTDSFPSGSLIKQLGNIGDIEAESELLLLENNIDYFDFPNEAFFGLPNIEDDQWMTSEQQWPLPSSELKYRRDFRNQCVFTIDPLTARDLDDALSIKQLNQDLYEVGVHIADVSFFLNEAMPLDQIARRRATSVYLVQKVIPMLPRILCERLCSLNAGEDKLTFSVVWVIDKNANILEEWFGRSIINSSIKLSYELAQDMIENPERVWTQNELPTIYGEWDYKTISKSVNLLNDIAVKLRKQRFDSGALRIDKLKLQFVLDKESGLPTGFSPYVLRDSNRLVEEFMLLANMAVAHKIYTAFGDKAFLRCHPPPAEEALNDFKSFCKYNGFSIDTTSSLTLQKSLELLVNNDSNISRVVAHFLLKAMQTAKYLCVGMQSASQTLHHYALNVPLYTHFTSPIRRYPDVIVHRLLASALSYRQEINESAFDLHRLAQHCNDTKLSARLVSEGSSKLFLHLFIKQLGKIEAKAIVVQVYDHSFDVMILNCDHLCRVYLDQLPIKRFAFSTKSGKNQLILEWNDPKEPQKPDMTVQQTIIACLILKVQVSVNEDESKLNALIQHPNGIFYRKDVRTNQFSES